MRIGILINHKLIISQNEKTRIYICKNPYLTVPNLLFAKNVHKKQEKKYKNQRFFTTYILDEPIFKKR